MLRTVRSVIVDKDSIKTDLVTPLIKVCNVLVNRDGIEAHAKSEAELLPPMTLTRTKLHLYQFLMEGQNCDKVGDRRVDLTHTPPMLQDLRTRCDQAAVVNATRAVGLDSQELVEV